MNVWYLLGIVLLIAAFTQRGGYLGAALAVLYLLVLL